MTFTPKAVIFDWDGVIIDSSDQHKRAWETMAAEHNLPLPDDHFERSFGLRNETIIPTILKWATDPVEAARLADIKEETYRALVRAEGTEPLPGVVDLLTALRDQGIHRVVGSSTPRGNLDCCMDITGLRDFFEGSISGDDVENGKPNPEVFLKAAALVDTDPADALVFEDAFAGIKAAVAGGIPVIGVATTHAIDSLHEANAAVHRLTEIALEDGVLSINRA